MAATMPEDVICFSCGRVISGTSGMSSRSRGDFRRTTTRGAKRGLSPKMAAAQASGRRTGQPSAKQAALSRARKGSMKNLALVGLVSFIFLFTPAQEQFMQMADDIKDMIPQSGREYPVEISH